MTRRAVPLLALALCGLLGAWTAAGFAAAAADEPERPQLRMEDIEVHGSRERPGELFVPAPPPVSLPSRVRYDLFLEDMKRPILPWQIPADNNANGGNRDDADVID